jgi:GDP-4-dehydro-6-deoxy-D-mannose reductase
MRILVTGITGFTGGHLAEALLGQAEVQLYGLCRRPVWPEEWKHLATRVPVLGCDLCDAAGTEAVLREVQPDQIYHLAGYAHAGRSFREADAAWVGNLTATRSLYDAVSRWGSRPRILYVGSGLIYGDVARPGQGLDESCVLHPLSPYATSKAAADLLSYQCARAPGLDIVRVRPFNHFGPRQSPQYAVAHFAAQIAAIERGQRPSVLETGNLAPLRDLTDVRDMVRAYLLLMKLGRTGEVYNAGSGKAHSMQEVVDRLLALARVRVEVRQQASLVRATDTAAVCADAGKLRRATGWVPVYPLEQTLADTLEYWRNSVVPSP